MLCINVCDSYYDSQIRQTSHTKIAKIFNNHYYISKQGSKLAELLPCQT